MVNAKDPFLIPGTTDPVDIAVWISRISKNRSAPEKQMLFNACQLASEVHANQKRISGDPYLQHVLTVADILADLGMDTEVLVAAILHDVPEAADITILELEKKFGKTVVNLITGVLQMQAIEEIDENSQEQQSESLRKMILAMAEDVRVVLIKLADRLDNIRVLRFLPEEKRRRFAQKTLDLYTPLANRLGIWQIKWELEDLSLRYIEPKTYQDIARFIDERRLNREAYIKKVIYLLEQELSKVGIHAEISGRPKHIYSIWRKMQRKNLDFQQIFDVRAVRVLVKTVKECYVALGTIHNQWKPIPNEFDDYIANPKANHYQSLHTAVLGPENKTFEVQIRTYDMHHHAELGVAAHWRYKETRTQADDRFEQKIAWLRQLLSWKEEEVKDDTVFINRFKSEVFEDRVYVLSPKGKIVDLPKGATPLDFAYAIHTELGHRCRGAKINNKIVSLNHILKTGVQVEIITGEEIRPSRDWINPRFNYLKTTRAINRVKQWLKKQDVHQHIADGKSILDRELRRFSVQEQDISYEQLAKKLNFSSINNLLAGIGRGDTSLAQISRAISEIILPKSTHPPVTPPSSIPAKNKTKNDVHITGVGNLSVQMAGCCNPIPYDPIVGYVTKGRGVTVHRRDCPNALRWQEEGNERLLEVEWYKPEQKQKYPVDIEIQALDRNGLLVDVTNVISAEKINISACNTLTNKNDSTVRMIFTIEVNDLEQLGQVLTKIDSLSNVLAARRHKH